MAVELLRFAGSGRGGRPQSCAIGRRRPVARLRYAPENCRQRGSPRGPGPSAGRGHGPLLHGAGRPLAIPRRGRPRLAGDRTRDSILAVDQRMFDRVEGRACCRYILRIRSAHRRLPSMIVRTVTAAALATVLLIACEDGPGTPGPAWAPPAWVHGTWTATGATGSLTMVASAHNLQVSMSTGGGVTVTVDMAKLAEEGIATIEYQGGSTPAPASGDKRAGGTTGSLLGVLNGR